MTANWALPLAFLYLHEKWYIYFNMKSDQKLKLIFTVICTLLSLIIILDFSIASEPITEEVVAVSATRESHNNAGGNSHFSFKARTENHHFSVSEGFAGRLAKGDEVKLSYTPLFNEVNTVRITETGESEIFSLRLLSGLILPLLIIIVMALGYKFGSKWSNVVFVFEVLAFADFVYLIN